MVGLPNSALFKTNAMKEQESTTSYTLIWEVLSFTPLIEYSLLFREYLSNKDSMRYDWTKLTIPAEYSNGIVHTMLYTLKGIKEKTKYEALLLSRNKYGWSKPSSILRFATKGAGKMNVFLKIINNTYDVLFSDSAEEENTTLITVEPEVTDFIAIDFSSVVSSARNIHITYEPILITILFCVTATYYVK